MNFLARIAEEKRLLVKEKKESTCFESLMKKAKKQHKRPFYDVFKEGRRNGVKIIAEIKRASPTRGMLKKDINVAELARKYEEGGASAISIITEATYFKGSLGFIQAAKEATCLPVLRKDFIIDAWELYESKAYGADAVLLIGEMLEQSQIKELLLIARAMDLDVLLEVHSRETLEKVSDIGGFLLGINNRNLDTMTVDLATAATMLAEVPDHVPVIIESGIEERKNIAPFVEKGASGFLVGTSLVQSRDPVKKLKELIQGS